MVLRRQRCCLGAETQTRFCQLGSKARAGVVSGIRNLVPFEKKAASSWICVWFLAWNGWVSLSKAQACVLSAPDLLLSQSPGQHLYRQLIFMAWCALCLINFGTLGTFYSSIKNSLGYLDAVLILTEPVVFQTTAHPLGREIKPGKGPAEMDFVLSREYWSCD